MREGFERSWWVFIVAGVILLSVMLRFWKLNSLPPGLYFDEAFNAVDAGQVISGSTRPLYFTGNNGREPLFIYLQALSVALLGPTPFALRLLSALIGILTVPIIYLGAREILSGGEPKGASKLAYLPLVAAAALAISYWHLTLSRLAFRVILLPPISTLAVLFFWRAFRWGRYRDYAWSAGWFALALYTYVAARLLPLVPLFFVFSEVIRDSWRLRSKFPSMLASKKSSLWRGWRTRLAGLLLMVGIGVLLLLPLGVVIWRDPTILSARTEDVSILTASVRDEPGTPRERFERNIVKVVRNFYDQGDLNRRHNLPGRSVNDPLLALLFTLGLLWALCHLGEARYRLLLIWFVVMLLPTLLSTQAPHNLRAAGAIPPLMLLIAVGAESIIRLPPFKGRAARQSAGWAILLAAILVVSGGWTVRDYFGRWANSSGLGHAFELDKQLAAQTLAEFMASADHEQSMLIPQDLFFTPQMYFAVGDLAGQDLPPGSIEYNNYIDDVIFLLRERHDLGNEGDLALHQSNVLVWWDASRGEYVTSRLQPLETTQSRSQLQEEFLMSLSGRGALTISSPHHIKGWPRLFTGSLTSEIWPEPRRIRYPLNVSFANGLELIGYDLHPDIITQESASEGASASEGQLLLTLFWRPAPQMRLKLETEKKPADNFHLFVHLVASPEERGRRDTTHDVQENGPLAYPPLSFWSPGRVREERRLISVPPTDSAYRAFFEVGLYYPAPRKRGDGSFAAGDRIDIIDGLGRIAADQVNIAPLMIGSPPPQADLSGLHSVGAFFAEQIELAGVHVSPDNTSRTIHVKLGWRTKERILNDYTVFVHLLDANHQIVAQNDHLPSGAELPTTLWVPGESLLDTFSLSHLEADASPAQNLGMALRIGLYEPVSGKRAPLTRLDNQAFIAGDTFVLIPLDALEK